MSEIGTKPCNLDELNKIIEDCFNDPIAILERYYCMDNEMPDFFDYLSKLKGNVSEWDKGRVFDNNSEVRWEKDKIGFHLVWIKDGDDIPDGWSKEVLKSIDCHEISLWGTKISGKKEWYEKQIPRIFEYPIRDIGNMAYVVINEYIHEDGSKSYRFREVKAK